MICSQEPSAKKRTYIWRGAIASADDKVEARGQLPQDVVSELIYLFKSGGRAS